MLSLSLTRFSGWPNSRYKADRWRSNSMPHGSRDMARHKSSSAPCSWSSGKRAHPGGGRQTLRQDHPRTCGTRLISVFGQGSDESAETLQVWKMLLVLDEHRRGLHREATRLGIQRARERRADPEPGFLIGTVSGWLPCWSLSTASTKAASP